MSAAALPREAAGGSWLAEVAARVDPRMRAALRADYDAAVRAGQPLPGPGVQVVLVGHRAAGKSLLLPVLARALSRPAVDLDVELARRHGRSLRAWLAADPDGFREAERETFVSLDSGALVAAGGGFLSLHPDLLEGRCPVLVPVSFRTQRERLLADTTRPRLMPGVGLEEELRQVFRARELAHARVRTLPLGALVAALDLHVEGPR